MPMGGGSRVSVVIPAHNAERYLKATLQSALNQSEVPLEIVVVDDASTDATSSIARSFGPLVRVIPNEGPRGASRARNCGVRAALGELIGFLDADDLALPKRFELQAARLSSPGGAAATFCDVVHIDGDGRLLGEPVTFAEFDSGHFFGQLIERNRIATTSAVMVRRSKFFEAGGFDETLSFNEEYDLWLRLARSRTFSHGAQVLLQYRLHPGNISRDREGQRINEALALAKFDRETLLDALAALHRAPLKARLSLALVYLRVGDTAKCTEVLEGCEEAFGGEPLFFFASGNLLLLEGLHAEAAKRYRSALALDPELAPAMNNLGVCLAHLGESGHSRAALSAALGLKPGYADPVANLSALARGDLAALRPTLVPLRDVLKPQL